MMINTRYYQIFEGFCPINLFKTMIKIQEISFGVKILGRFINSKLIQSSAELYLEKIIPLKHNRLLLAFYQSTKLRLLILDIKLPVMKSNLGMGSTDRNICNTNFTLMPPANFYWIVLFGSNQM